MLLCPDSLPIHIIRIKGIITRLKADDQEKNVFNIKFEFQGKQAICWLLDNC